MKTSQMNTSATGGELAVFLRTAERASVDRPHTSSLVCGASTEEIRADAPQLEAEHEEQSYLLVLVLAQACADGARLASMRSSAEERETAGDALLAQCSRARN